MRDDPIRGEVIPSTVEGQGTDPALRAAAAAVQRMSEEGRSGKVTVSMAVEVEQYAEPEDPHALVARHEEDRRFALVIALVLGVLVTLFTASLSFMPGPLGLLIGVVAGAWIYGQVKP